MRKHLWTRRAALLLGILLALTLAGCTKSTPKTPAAPATKDYTLAQMTVLSRHNIRAPLSTKGSALDSVTSHDWIEWSAEASQLSLRGGILETMMGQYFRKYLDAAGLIPENTQPEAGAVRFYANAKQRTVATARAFAAALLPVAPVEIETHAEYDTMDPVFTPAVTGDTEAFRAKMEQDLAKRYGKSWPKAINRQTEKAVALLCKVLDYKDSDDAKEKGHTVMEEGDIALHLEVGAEPTMTGTLKSATTAADALLLQLYESRDARSGAFGHEVTDQEWARIVGIVDTYSRVLFGMPSVAPHLAHPLLRELRQEMTAPGRQFTYLCGHDSNIVSVMAALGIREPVLPGAYSQTAPIGCKLVIERFTDRDGQDWAALSLVYQTTEQLRDAWQLDPAHPPMQVYLQPEGLEMNPDGLYRFEDVLARFDEAIAAYDATETEN